MKKTKIEWCDSTWNPVTGCLHGCKYCYADRIAKRFGGASETHYNECVGEECQWCTEETRETHDLTEPIYDVDRGHKAPYPFGFDPTMHRYRLDEIKKRKKPRNIFVCSMADLFGDWVPDEWIKAVFNACEAAPQHNYMFLTKNVERYTQYGVPIQLDNMWYGTSVTKEQEVSKFNYLPAFCNTFVSIEPIMEDLLPDKHNILFKQVGWVIVGAETGQNKNKVIPKKEWIDKIVVECKKNNTPVFMKDSLIPVVGEANMLRQFPAGLEGQA